MRADEEIQGLRRAGDPDKAYERGLELLGQHPEDSRVKNQFGWVLYDNVKSAVEQACRNGSRVGDAAERARAFLRHYARLDYRRPDLLFSRLLIQLLRLPEPPAFLPKYLEWAGLDSFRPEDYQAGRDPERERIYEPLVEKAATKAAKAALRNPDSQPVDFVVRLLDEALRKAEVRRASILRYHKGRLLESLGRMDEAQRALREALKDLRQNFWAWHAYARVHRDADPDLALALYARACQVCDDPSMGVKVFEELGAVCMERDLPELGKWAIERAAGLRERNGGRLAPSLARLRATDRYAAIALPGDPEGILETHGARAKAALYGQVPKVNANFLGTFGKGRGGQKVRVAFRDDGQLAEAVGPQRDLVGKEDYAPGEPVSVRVVREGDRVQLVEVSRREDGAPYDCLDVAYGIVESQNPDHGGGRLCIGPALLCDLPYARCPAAREWPVGTAVNVWYSPGRARPVGHVAQVTTFRETAWARIVEGSVCVHEKGFGFLDDVFVPPAVVRSLEDAQSATLVAINRKPPKPRQSPWVALGPPSDR
jgi:tetratricopeptide (TPR) repeat protein